VHQQTLNLRPETLNCRFDAGSVFERSEAGRKRVQQGREALATFGMLLERSVPGCEVWGFGSRV